MDTYYLSEFNQTAAKECLTVAVEMGINFKLRNNPLNLEHFDVLYESVAEHLPPVGMPIHALLDFINTKILPHSTNYASPYAMAFPDSGNSIAGLAGAILSDFMNQNLINWVPCSPMGTIIEMIVINWLRQLVGYPVCDKPSAPQQVGGVVTTGGVGSNTIAMLLAREKRFPNTMLKGVSAIQRPYAFIVPDGIDHYSSRLSVGWLGMGEDNIVKVKTKDFKYDLHALETTAHDLVSRGVVIISLTAYAGDSRSMSCDDFHSLRQLCDKYGIWFHVDGCHGTQLLFSETLKQTVCGIELADSITFDPHKVLNLPYTLSLVLVKDADTLNAIKRPEDIITGESHSFGQVTPFFGSRAFQSLKLYMLMKHLGRCGLAEVIERRCELAGLLAQKIRESQDFTLINPKLGINSVIFMYSPPEIPRDTPGYLTILNKLNADLHQSLLAQGDIWLHSFNIPDSSNVFGFGHAALLRPLRYMSGNPILNALHLESMLNKVREHGKKLLLSIQSTILQDS